MTVLRNAVEDARKGGSIEPVAPAVPAVLEQAVRVSGSPIEPVAPAMPGQSDDEGGAAG